MSESYIVGYAELPYYLTVEMIVDREKERASFRVKSSVHVNKEWSLPTAYSLEYFESRPNSVRAEVLDHIVKFYGLKLEMRYS